MIRSKRWYTSAGVTLLLAGASLTAGGRGLAATPAPAPVTASHAQGVAPSLRVGTFNICKSTCGPGPFGWANRRGALVRTVGAAAPDILAVQEANTKVWRGVRQTDDVIGLLSPLGYRIASQEYSGCPGKCSRGAHVFYNTATTRLADLPGSSVAVAGMTSMAAVGGIDLSALGIQDRAISWAFLSALDSARITLVISVHLATQKTAAGESARVAVANHLRGYAQSLIAASGQTGVELVICGDFNSYGRRQPQGAQQILADTGLIDGYTAPEKVNGDLSSINIAPTNAKFKGWPPKPFHYTSNTTHIDYVFSTVAPLRHEVVAHLLPDGSFDNNYRVSDHNLVLVELPLS
ncbi:MAG: endonuclease/exonuclease/phosphatase family protein [Candidatus Nanopelagicales bacterium]